MQLRTLLLGALAAVAFAANNEPCYGPNGAAGVCMNANSCTAKGGTTINGACPSDPAGIKCCSKPTCANGANGNCKWSSDCAGSSLSNQCPGPAGFKCCSSKANGCGGYQQPAIPPVGACKANAVNGARSITNGMPGRVRQVYCTRDCACGSGSDHCCGLAADLMLSDAGGTPTLCGKDVAEYAMNRAAALKVKYVIWGQRIWNPSQDSVKPWGQWRTMEDRGDVTQNHWDHVHVSFKP